MSAAKERYARHVALFGAEGQARVGSSTVVIVGLGGLGCHVAQQLAYLGVRSFVLLDGDEVTASSLNRLIGARPADVGTAKVAVGERMIAAIAPDASVLVQQEKFDADWQMPSLGRDEVLFGCVDEDPARFQLLRYASAWALPYLDLAGDVGDSGAFGGRVVFAKNGERCLHCLGELDRHALARAEMTEQQRAADDRIYGVDRAALAHGGPSVVSINGVVASLAVTEFMVWRTGLREPAGFLNYRGDLGTVGRRSDPPRDHCVFCVDRWGSALPSKHT